MYAVKIEKKMLFLVFTREEHIVRLRFLLLVGRCWNHYRRPVPSPTSTLRYSYLPPCELLFSDDVSRTARSRLFSRPVADSTALLCPPLAEALTLTRGYSRLHFLLSTALQYRPSALELWTYPVRSDLVSWSRTFWTTVASFRQHK